MSDPTEYWMETMAADRAAKGQAIGDVAFEAVMLTAAASRAAAAMAKGARTPATPAQIAALDALRAAVKMMEEAA